MENLPAIVSATGVLVAGILLIAMWLAGPNGRQILKIWAQRHTRILYAVATVGVALAVVGIAAFAVGLALVMVSPQVLPIGLALVIGGLIVGMLGMAGVEEGRND